MHCRKVSLQLSQLFIVQIIVKTDLVSVSFILSQETGKKVKIRDLFGLMHCDSAFICHYLA